MRVLQRVSDHVQTILAQAWLSSIAIFLIGLIKALNGPRRDILEPELVTVHIRIGPESSIRISRGPSHDDLGPAEVLPIKVHGVDGIVLGTRQMLVIGGLARSQ